jgi:hypothetical protein
MNPELWSLYLSMPRTETFSPIAIKIPKRQFRLKIIFISVRLTGKPRFLTREMLID